jgi:hypothetical protein
MTCGAKGAVEIIFDIRVRNIPDSERVLSSAKMDSPVPEKLWARVPENTGSLAVVPKWRLKMERERLIKGVAVS